MQCTIIFCNIRQELHLPTFLFFEVDHMSEVLGSTPSSNKAHHQREQHESLQEDQRIHCTIIS